MPAGQLYIKGAGSSAAWRDAYTTWGVSLNSAALSTLMTPPEVKAWVSNESELENGTRVVTGVVPKVNDRTVSLGLNMSAANEAAFLANYASFCEMLKGGVVNIKTSFQTGVVYKCLYVSCTQFAEYRLGLAKFILKLHEPNPADRTENA